MSENVEKEPSVIFKVEDGVAWIIFNRPEARNALNMEMRGIYFKALEQCAEDHAIRAVVLTHAGGTFCAGADLKEQASEGGPAIGTRRMLDLLHLIIELPKPMIARVDGHVRAGGIGLVGACDIAIAGPRATFAFTEVRLGLTPAIISLKGGADRLAGIWFSSSATSARAIRTAPLSRGGRDEWPPSVVAVIWSET